MIPELRRRSALESIEQFEFFRSVQWLDQVDSTNRHLDRQIKAGQVTLPCIAVADEQSAGVGRGANRWFSPQGCLMFSMAIEHTMLDPANTPQRLAMLPLRVGLALAQSLEPLVRSQPKVKWPNDVLVEDRKISGILIESQTVGFQTVGSQTVGSIGYAIIGIGINCTVEFDQAPEEVRRHAVSLHQVLANRDQEQASCESVLLGFLRSWFDLQEVCASEPDWIERNWPAWDWLADREIQVQQPTRTWYGRADGIGSDGSLRLIDSQAIRHTILSGTVRVLE
jgi:BirA family transcriptional regulator, biotin operon repressor / biotin---[acetyl-CoA-carboxylase] ligase